MKYNININQLALQQYYPSLNLVDAAILDYIMGFYLSDSQKIDKIYFEEGKEMKRYVWIDYKHLIKEMPILKIRNTDTIGRHISRLKKLKLIKTYLKHSETNGHKKTYVRLPEEINKLIFSNALCFEQNPLPHPSENKVGHPSENKGNNTITEHSSSTNVEEGRQAPLLKNYFSYKSESHSDSRENGKQEYGNLHINECISYLKEKNHNYLDGSMAGNRRYCWLLLLKIGYKMGKNEAVQAAKRIIDFAMSNKFHQKKATNFKYLYNYSHTIMKDLQ